jgi:hypothetical protein
MERHPGKYTPRLGQASYDGETSERWWNFLETAVEGEGVERAQLDLLVVMSARMQRLEIGDLFNAQYHRLTINDELLLPVRQ